jgi:hypothetical protein
MARTGLDHSSISSASNAKSQNPICIPTNKRDCIIHLREARIAVREIVAVSFQRRDQERQQCIHKLETSRNKSDARHAQLLRRLQRAEEIKFFARSAIKDRDTESLEFRFRFTQRAIQRHAPNGKQSTFLQRLLSTYSVKIMLILVKRTILHSLFLRFLKTSVSAAIVLVLQIFLTDDIISHRSTTTFSSCSCI